ncbi:hypothetical protein Skr01_66590 [Sphaerisporangium krabiense]|uniref:Uncharacterized protein n=1 Tax=Sphaerisporangium krabiense TaxID=763782 RepID=A0A7W8Z522_9ACTN|nr:hypothetical protein [Sphaerisporangium krabiense]MBB5627559.1 hypothetical protein [Sphaerisporangium krabiense]GII66574.1 hypothetical protein Skr01_66590 [Sphaerisporangium krabiense]
MSEMDVHGNEAAPDELLDDATEGLQTEVPEADAIEQRLDVRTERREWPIEVSYDVDPADAADQNRTVEFGDDEYR